jgi:hypothetical protein
MLYIPGWVHLIMSSLLSRASRHCLIIVDWVRSEKYRVLCRGVSIIDVDGIKELPSSESEPQSLRLYSTTMSAPSIKSKDDHEESPSIDSDELLLVNINRP